MEIATVEDRTREVEVPTDPCWCSLLLKVLADDLDDREPHLASTRHIRGVGVVWKAKVATEHIYALLLLLLPLVGQCRHRVHASQTNRGVVASQLDGGRTEPFGPEPPLLPVTDQVLL